VVKVSLAIYDALGNKVADVVDSSLTPGTYSYQWNASGYASGIYFYTLESGKTKISKKMILTK
jgi:hypothetical protein